jgi:hypothetical protein
MVRSQTTVKHFVIRLAGFALIALNCGVAIIFIYVWLSAAQRDYFAHVDFTTFYTAGSIARDGLGRSIYDINLQTQYQSKILNQVIPQADVLPFNNPPFTVYPFILVSRLPLRSAFLLWTILQSGMLLWLFYLLFRFSASWMPIERWLMISGVMAFTPLLVDFMLGTFSLLLLLCIFQFYLELKRERDVRSVGWLILEFIKPQIALLPGFLLLGSRRWKTIAAAIVIGICLAIITTLSFGWQVWLDFARNINAATRNFNSFGIVPAVEYNLKGFLTMLMGESRSGLINQISVAALLLSCVVVLWIWRGPWQVKLDAFEVKFSLTIMLSLVLSLHLNPYDSLLLVAPSALFYNFLRGKRSSGLAFGIFLVCCPYIFLYDFFILNGRMGFHFPFVLMVVITFWIAKELLFGSRQKGLITEQITS